MIFSHFSQTMNVGGGKCDFSAKEMQVEEASDMWQGHRASERQRSPSAKRGQHQPMSS